MNTLEFCVGQLVSFVPHWEPQTPDYIEGDSFFHWHLPDKFVNEPYPYSYCCNSYRRNDAWLAYRTTHCWYVNKPGGACSIGMNLKFSNGQAVSIAAAGNFTVYRPTVNQPVPHGPFGATISGGMLSLEDGPMHFDVTINSKYPGSFGLTQLVKMYSETIIIPPDVLGGSTTWGSFNRDGGEYYDGPNPVSQPCRIEDTPGQPLVFFMGDYTGNWKDYVRFIPDGGIPVTLGRIDWNWAATCVNPDPLIGWYITSDGVDGPSSVHDDDDSFPLWEHVGLFSF